jgi:hypothetical protein
VHRGREEGGDQQRRADHLDQREAGAAIGGGVAGRAGLLHAGASSAERAI